MWPRRLGCRSAALLAAPWLVGTAAGCSSANHDNPSTISDTTGAAFDWVCSDDGCDATPAAGTPPLACGGGYTIGRLLVLDAFPLAEFGRAVACGGDGDCPQFAKHRYACRSGLCESTDVTTLSEFDVLALCLAATPRLPACHDALVDPTTTKARSLTNSTCNGQDLTCASVPATCRQP